MKKNIGNYILILKGELREDCMASCKKRPIRAACHFARSIYREFKQFCTSTSFEVEFIRDKTATSEAIRFKYHIDIRELSPEEKKGFRVYDIKGKQISKRPEIIIEGDVSNVCHPTLATLSID